MPDKTVYQDGDKLVSKGLKVKAVYKNGTEKDVTDYVKLSDINGLGTNKIKVIYRGCETTFDVEVNEVKAESITLDKTNIILEIGKTEQLNPVIKPDNVSNKKVSYESSDNSIASVDSEGKITALKEGNVIITATTSNNLKVECEVQVIKHTHQWNEGQVSREPSCTEVGEKEYICKTCGEKKTEEIVAKGHEWSSEYTVDKKATCTEKGTESIHCKVCGAIKEGSEKEISATGHQWDKGKVTKEPDCTKAGEKEYTCETCGAKKTEEIAAKGHEWSNEYTVDKKATCTEKGEESIHCKVCGEIKEGSQKEISAYNHSETEIKNAKKETYTSEGYTGDIYCKICNKKISTGKKIKKLIAKIPQKVIGCKLVAKKKKIKVSYKKVIEGVKYQIQYSVKKNMKSSKIRTTKNTQYLITKLKSKKKYYVRIRAINNQGRFGAWSQIKHVKTK
ncbi:MAG: Ig-like domain-containing protein [Anaerostipes hadrus]|nr:Ig-like domain-containing protein [Anaerostipes hadrus]